MKVRGSVARRAITDLCEDGKIRMIVQHSGQMVYTRLEGADDE